jgi:hypothetical protein
VSTDKTFELSYLSDQSLTKTNQNFIVFGLGFGLNLNLHLNLGLGLGLGLDLCLGLGLGLGLKLDCYQLLISEQPKPTFLPIPKVGNFGIGRNRANTDTERHCIPKPIPKYEKLLTDLTVINNRAQFQKLNISNFFNSRK